MTSNNVKTGTLAGQLQHFAQSVDVVEDRTFEAVRRLVYRYVTTELKGSYFELMKEQPVGNGDRQLWIKTFWSSQNREHLWQVHANQKNASVVEAFNSGRPLWLLDVGKEPLGDAGRYKDHWSELTGMPRTSGQPAGPNTGRRTLYYRRQLGIYIIAIPAYIERSDVGVSELERLADALAILLELWYVNRTQAEYTAEAIADLNQVLISARFPRLAKPHFFVAYSKRADHAVTSILTEVLDGCSEKLEFSDWAEMSNAGKISLQIGDEIGRSR